ncbi:small, acid-soluble spore protein, alpha/beta type [[Clostridium] polysaccharolyticum]|uniref:Small, acid-soluble spore protein, alpha/beta type n=1 Tax=[Clostridium] polysaccharolyticum TaxID=29364 RepID=A0A1H9ZGG1_9FIRM|nr:small, acid-soluble spore protein, alpha/beta type [[Clostridium] polysaccharolyticum]SES80753.1 Small, acid-soluble spore protein, alpha/beta type [[Clostridium] polysaccharolyticum]
MPKEKKEKPKILNMEDVKQLPKKDQLKYEIAEEIGVVDKVFKTGWRSLSAKESGRIGGILASRSKQKGN